MNILYHICIGLSAGIILGVFVGVIKSIIERNKVKDEKKLQSKQKFINKTAKILKIITFMLLALGLIWCSYFLIVGITMPAKADYANNMAELIVAVLTVISILFAFVEFLRKKDTKDENKKG